MNPNNVIKMERSRLEKIIQGHKVATLRKGRRDYELGEALIIDDSTENCAVNVTITRIEVIKFKNLTKKIVKEEGYSSLEELKSSMKKIYPDITEDSDVTHVVFKLNKGI